MRAGSGARTVGNTAEDAGGAGGGAVAAGVCVYSGIGAAAAPLCYAAGHYFGKVLGGGIQEAAIHIGASLGLNDEGDCTGCKSKDEACHAEFLSRIYAATYDTIRNTAVDARSAGIAGVADAGQPDDNLVAAAFWFANIYAGTLARCGDDPNLATTIDGQMAQLGAYVAAIQAKGLARTGPKPIAKDIGAAQLASTKNLFLMLGHDETQWQTSPERTKIEAEIASASGIPWGKVALVAGAVGLGVLGWRHRATIERVLHLHHHA